MARVKQMADHATEQIRSTAGADHVLHRLDNLVVAVGHIIVIEHPPARESGLARLLGLEEVDVQIIERRELLHLKIVRDASGRELVQHGLDDGLQFGGSLADGDPGAHAERVREDLKVDVQPVVDKVVSILVEDLCPCPNHLGVERVRGVEVQRGARRRKVREGLDGGGEDDAVRGRAAAAERPVEVLVLPLVGVDDETGGGDYFEVEHVVDGETLESRPGAVAAALDETAG